ncbi:ribonuclease domain-containing protein [Paenibacillus sp. 481]|uniref:ribonuclease domain-containing protein n=1 Tax=Paenibacillus sp. 481 TaxID=2835869 RepID=UPI001E356D2F|nr:ribonuclease domain-containing protein [Paenibacillus sp. 481]UHA75501.1 barnase [Paenibacillus sp. 481]
MKKWVQTLSIVYIVCLIAGLVGCVTFPPAKQVTPQSDKSLESDQSARAERTAHTCGLDPQLQPLTTYDEVVAYLKEHNKLPPNYIKKSAAKNCGWVPREGNLQVVAPKMSIGGDVFSNAEGLLPKASNRKWTEADINYHGGHRGKFRLVYSNDGLYYKTEDHYRTFQRIP